MLEYIHTTLLLAILGLQLYRLYRPTTITVSGPEPLLDMTDPRQAKALVKALNELVPDFSQSSTEASRRMAVIEHREWCKRMGLDL